MNFLSKLVKIREQFEYLEAKLASGETENFGKLSREYAELKPVADIAIGYLKALEERDDNFFSIDGDVVLKNPLPDFKDDVLVDFMSLDRYKLYRNGIPNVPSSVNTLKQFEDTNVQSIFPYFDTTQQVPIPTTGVLKFNNDKKRYKYLESWKNLYKLTKDNNINPKIATSVAAEYALGCLINKNKWSYRELSTLQEGRYNSPFYKHYMGKIKFKPGIVNFDLPNASLI